MGKFVGFILAVIGGILIAKVLGPMSARQLHEVAQTRKQEQPQFQSMTPRRELSLQDIIHGEVLEGRKGLPRMKADGIRLVSVDEAQHQMIYTYELVGVPSSAINSSIVREMQQEIFTSFRNSACRNNQVQSLLRQGMSVAQIYRLTETNQKLFTLVLSIRDC